MLSHVFTKKSFGVYGKMCIFAGDLNKQRLQIAKTT
jgi:hypothetical protein